MVDVNKGLVNTPRREIVDQRESCGRYVVVGNTIKSYLAVCANIQILKGPRIVTIITACGL
jgi:hypothetical protein